jgi:hypothetical protein
MEPWIKHSFETTGGATLIVGSYEVLRSDDQLAWIAKSVHLCINVSDSPCYSHQMISVGNIWFPIVEHAKWPITSLYGITTTIDAFNKPGRRIYIHCHGGITRSRAVIAIWLLSQSSIVMTHAEEIVGIPTGYLSRLMDLGRFSKHDLDVLRYAHRHPMMSLSEILKTVDRPCELQDNLEQDS